MKKIRKFGQMKDPLGDTDVVIQLTTAEYDLLQKILDESYETRASMGCNDPYSGEENLFSDNDREEIRKYLIDRHFCDEEMSWLSNDSYVWYMIKRLEEENEKNKI